MKRIAILHTKKRRVDIHVMMKELIVTIFMVKLIFLIRELFPKNVHNIVLATMKI
jgi:hypothetical protein